MQDVKGAEPQALKEAVAKHKLADAAAKEEEQGTTPATAEAREYDTDGAGGAWLRCIMFFCCVFLLFCWWFIALIVTIVGSLMPE